MFAKLKTLTALAAFAALTPLAAHAAANTFNFYSTSPLTNEVSFAPNYVKGDLSVTVRAFDTTGKQLQVAIRYDGLGAFGGGADNGNIDSLFGGTAEYLELTFNKSVKLNALGLSLWDNDLLFFTGDRGTLSTGNQTVALNSSNNDGGLLVKTFNFSGASALTGTVFKLGSTGNLSSFRLAGIGATAVTPVPEPATLALMGLGLAGIAFTARRQGAKAQPSA